MLSLAPALLLSGCLAASFAPLGLQLVEALGVSAGQSMSGKTHDPELDDELSSAGCEQLLSAVPYIAEVQTEPGGGVRLRRWQIVQIGQESRWRVAPASGADAAGWRTDNRLSRLGFTPPLQTALASTGGRYLIAAPSEPADSAEAAQLLSLTLAFGPQVGTYQWKQRQYEYALAKTLPCVPVAATDD